MDLKYLFIRLYVQGAKMRRAQLAYYACKADPRTDPIKKGLLAEARRREQDYDQLATKLPSLTPDLRLLETIEKELNG